ncbi:deoxyribose-phosphate aldolase [Lawsonibacter sp. LCP25S3_G6]|uniref:deoxyribose-phosphate aldolase n=1 Tax=unclassified Lawsonibacter TaxID=2617946 RepID=UPI003F96E756
MILTGKEAAALIDISIVRTNHSYRDLLDVVELAKQHRFINVHVLPCWVSTLAQHLKDVEGVYVGSPVGFPSGAATTLTKLLEAEQLMHDGVEEMDIVMNVGKFKAGEYDYVLRELREIVGMTDHRVKTKVIIETRALAEDEIYPACDLVKESGADFVKTGTGWIPGQLDLGQVRRIKEYCGKDIKLKVAGGVRTREDFVALFDMGIERVGINAQSAVEIVDSLNATPYYGLK